MSCTGGCQLFGHPLVNSNTGYFLLGVVHLLIGTPLGSIIFFLLASFSSIYHYTHHIVFTKTLIPWKHLDLVAAYSAMSHNLWLFTHDPLVTSKVCGAAICFSTLILYYWASNALATGDMKSYIKYHALWHWMGALGSFLILLSTSF